MNFTIYNIIVACDLEILFPCWQRELIHVILQLQSFETELAIPEIAAKEGGPPNFRGVFIRAPAIIEVGPEVEVLADIPVPSDKSSSTGPAVQIQEVCLHLLLLVTWVWYGYVLSFIRNWSIFYPIAIQVLIHVLFEQILLFLSSTLHDTRYCFARTEGKTELTTLKGVRISLGQKLCPKEQIAWQFFLNALVNLLILCSSGFIRS